MQNPHGSPEQGQTGRRAAGQDPAKRTQILEGAKRCFLRVGFEAASMNEITAEAGVSKGTIYVYFEDKTELFRTLIDKEKSDVTELARQKLGEGGTTAETLQRFGLHVTIRLTGDVAIRAQRMVLGVIEKMPDLAAHFFGLDTYSPHGLLKGYLDDKVREGELRIPDTEFAAWQLLELFMASVYKRRLFGNLPEPLSEAELTPIVASGVTMFLTAYGVMTAKSSA